MREPGSRCLEHDKGCGAEHPGHVASVERGVLFPADSPNAVHQRAVALKRLVPRRMIASIPVRQNECTSGNSGMYEWQQWKVEGGGGSGNCSRRVRMGWGGCVCVCVWGARLS